MDVVWNVNTAEQVRAQTERAMRGQSSDMRDTAARFRQEATRHRNTASQLRTRLNNQINSSDPPSDSAIASREAEIARLTNLANQLEQYANRLDQAASDFDHAISRSNALYNELLDMLLETDNACAIRLQQILDEIAHYNQQMHDLLESFDINPSDSVMGRFGDNAVLLSYLAMLGQNDEAFLMQLQQAGLQKSSASVADPINIATGNFYYSKEDLTIPGRTPLTFKRFYNAMGGLKGPLGPNWTHNYNIRLYNEGECIRIAFDDGHVETYTKIEEGRYLSPKESNNLLTIPEDDKGFYLTTQTMQRYYFNETGALCYITDPNDNTTYLEYTAGQLTEVRNPSGSISFKYNNEGSLTSLSDHTGRQVTYEYDNENNNHHLTKATHPTGATYQYKYDPRGLLNQIINPQGIATATNEYDKEGRTIRQYMADGGIATLEYDDARKINTITEQNGNKIEYYRDDHYRTTRIAYDHFDERFVFDDRNNCTQHTDRNMNSWWYEYDPFGNMTKSIDPLGNTTLMEYNNFSKPTKITTPNGSNITLTYDDYGNPTGATDPLGRKTSCTLDEKGRITTLTMPDTSKSTLTYDTRGNITTITDSAGATTQYQYNPLNQVTKTINGEGQATSYEYNPKGSITKVTNAQGNTRTYEYSLSGKVTKITDFNNSTIEYKYTPTGKIEEVTDQQGGTTKVTYDIMQNVTSITDPCGNTIYYEYDKYNRVTRTIDPEGHATTYRHDPNGNVIFVTSPLGVQTRILYDALNRQKSIIEPDGATTSIVYDASGNVTQVTDALGNTTTREYDASSQLTTLTDPLGNQTRFTYTALGQIRTMENAKGQQQSFNYYPGGKLKTMTLFGGETESYEYNKNGKVSKITDTLGNITTLSYNSLDQVIQTINPLGHSKGFTYDAVGNITKITGENGNATQYKYSPLGDVVEVIDAMGNSKKYDYDSARRLIKLEQMQSTQAKEPQITTYQYNKKGEVIAVTSPLGDAVNYAYDATGNVISKRDEDGLETLYEYNIANKLTQVSYADGKTVALTYNALKQLTEMKDWLGTTTIELDALGRTTKTTDHEGNQVGYEYNELNQREKLVYPDGREVAYEYNASGRLETVITGLSTPETTRYKYDPMGRITERILPDKTKTAYEFNPIGALTSLTHTADSYDNSILDQFKYSYDPVGNITQIDKYRTGIEADNGVFQYVYDPLNRLIQATNSHDNNTKSYAYDNVGNRIATIQNGIETRHNFNARNQLIKTFEGDSITDFLYDNRGNLTQITQDGQLQASYTFDATNMMAAAHNHAKGTAEYTYDGFRNRVKKLESFHNPQGTTTANLPDPTKEVRYILDMTSPYDNLLMTQEQCNQSENPHTQNPQTQNSHTQSYIWGNSILSALPTITPGNTSDSSAFHYLHDHLGSPIRLRGGDNDNADILLAYDEFGIPEIASWQASQSQRQSQPQSQNPTNYNNPLGFTGYQIDDISGMYYAQARYYTPTTGRFTSPDPFWNVGNMQLNQSAIAQSSNLFAFSMNNPIRFVDPSGMVAIPQSVIDDGIGSIPKKLIIQAQAALGDGTLTDTCGGGGGISLTPSEIEAGVTIVVINGVRYMDLSVPVNAMLTSNANEARAQRDTGGFDDYTVGNRLFGATGTSGPGPYIPTWAIAKVTGDLIWLIDNVREGQRWDLKNPDSWEGELPGIRFIRYPNEFVVNGVLMNAADLGNLNFGYVASALEIPDAIQIVGAGLAHIGDHRRLPLENIRNFGDSPRCRKFTDMGRRWFNEGRPEC